MRVISEEKYRKVTGNEGRSSRVVRMSKRGKVRAREGNYRKGSVS